MSSAPTVWHACFEVRPLRGNEHFDRAGGAFVDCFVHSHDPQLAEFVMKMLLDERKWDVVAEKLRIAGIDPSVPITDPVTADAIHVAKERGEAFNFRFWAKRLH